METEEIIKKLQNPWDASHYFVFCTNDEIARIVNPITPQDELLRKRARIVSESTRYLRTFIALNQNIKNYSFEGCFSTKHYDAVLDKLSNEDKKLCNSIIPGDLFVNEIDGIAWLGKNNDKFISIDYGLRYFLYYLNLAILPFSYDENEVPPKIRYNSAVIATRLILKSETLDFLTDPRGIVPKHIHNQIIDTIDAELQFIAGHEYAHHLCNHLSNTEKKMMFSIGNFEYYEPVFNIDQKQELEADIESLKRPNYSENEYNKIMRGAILFLKSLEFKKSIESVVFPDDGRYKTHPEPYDRIKNIIHSVKKPNKFNDEEFSFISYAIDTLSKSITKEMETNYDEFEKYGSAYLDVPNTKWRGEKNTDSYWGT